MTRLRLYVLPRLCLGLSVLFFLFALWVLWLSLERPLPTVALACRQAERAGLSSSGTLLASGSAEPGQTGAHHDRWAVLRYGDGTYALAELDRRAGILWTLQPGHMQSLSLPSQGLLAFHTSPTVAWDPGEFWRDDYDISGTGNYLHLVPLALCTDPSVVRLEGEFLVPGSQEDQETAWAGRAVPIQWRSAGGSAWAGDPVSGLMPETSDGGFGGSACIRCRGYDAAGNLVCSYD